VVAGCFGSIKRIIERSTGKIGFSYGLLTDNWRDDLAKGFSECFRVLKPYGTLIFKWAETEFPLKEVLALTKEKPLYGHKSGKKATTHWVSFIKTVAPPKGAV
jgi:SAM-dependent methyltransferase